MINRFRVAMTLVVASQATFVGILGYATQIDYKFPVLAAIGLFGASIFLGIVSVQMPSWQASESVSKAASSAEKPDTNKD